jgi:hypothetical protein
VETTDKIQTSQHCNHDSYRPTLREEDSDSGGWSREASLAPVPTASIMPEKRNYLRRRRPQLSWPPQP